MADPEADTRGSADDYALVERCRRGDAAAKRALLEQVLPTLRGATASLLGPGADADDAAQQAAIDLLRGLGTYRGDASLASWARTIAVRAGLRTAQQRRRHLSAVDPETVQHPIADDELEDRAKERLPRSLQAYLDALPAEQRDALVLRHGLGYTVSEIAELVGSSVNTIKSRLLHARREVRKLIRRDETVAKVRRQQEES